MTENEAVHCLKVYTDETVCEECDFYQNCTHETQEDMARLAIKALEEIQQYRAIGTVEECREARERQEPRLLNDREIAFIGKGTEIQSRCPQCGIILGIGISEKPIIPKEIRHCFNCGQKLYL